ncbi:hypothetical protein [Pseudomonas aeruginosa]|jgi:hypothetical protein|uniref:hypothetical protein n=1 Tax=Pseudomonas aeruginosa TaxID=287 RepID=UPI0034E09B4E
MSSAYFASFILLDVIIDGPGEYLTRGGERVTIDQASTRHDFGCSGRYSGCNTQDHWHKSGRLSASSQSKNDIVARA